MKCSSGKQIHVLHIFRSSHPEAFLVKDFLNICSKFTGEHSCRSVISIKLLCNFIEMALRHGCSPVNLWHIFRTPFRKNKYGALLLKHSTAFRFDRIKQISENYKTKHQSKFQTMINQTQRNIIKKNVIIIALK